MNKIPLILTLLFFILYKMILIKTGEIWFALLVFVVPVGLLSINLSLRKSLRYSKWFLSSVNFLLERKKYVITSDIQSDLLFEKLIEVIDQSHFSLLDSNANSKLLLCGTSVNFWTWGENVYIDLKQNNNETTIVFISVTLFGNTSWKRNKNNFLSFTESFESSLTI